MTTKMRRAVWFLALSLSTPSSIYTAARGDDTRSLPNLPPIVPDNFPASLRDQLQAAYAAARANPHDARATGKLCTILQAYNKSDERAEVCYQRARLLDPASFRWAYYLATVQANRGKFNEAAATLRAALQLDAKYLPARLKLGETLLASGNVQEATKLYEQILREHPDSAQTYFNLGRARQSGNDLTAAIEMFRKACELFPYFGAAHYSLALAYRRQGKVQQAREEFALYEKNKYDIPGAGDRLQAELNNLYIDPSSLVQLGIQFADQGKLELAVAEHEKALQADPELIKAHVNLISLYARLHQFKQGEEHYWAAVQLNSNYAESHYNYGVLLMEEHKYKEAEEAFRKDLALNHDHAEAQNNLGDLLQRQGKFPEAVAEFRKAIANKPDFPQAHFNLGRILVKEENYQEAIQELLKTLVTEDEESKPSYVYAVGAAYVRAGDLENGVMYIRKAREAAAVRHQSKLLESIDRDLRSLEVAATPH